MPITTRKAWRDLPIGARYTDQPAGAKFPRRYVKLSAVFAAECVGLASQTIEKPLTRLQQLDALQGNQFKREPIITAGDPLTLDAFVANRDHMVTEGWGD